MKRVAWLALLMALGCRCSAPVRAADFLVSNVAGFNAAVASVQPGDTITLGNGTWGNVDMLFKANGTGTQPITLRAQTGGQVYLTGASRLRIVGSHLNVQGLVFMNPYHSSGYVIEFQENSVIVATNCRLSDCVMFTYPPSPGGDVKWVSLSGFSNRVDHCYFKGKANFGALLVVKLPPAGSPEAGTPNYHLIDYNWFGQRAAPGPNGGEALQLGDSATSFNISRTIIEQNYFEQCSGDIEIISSKSCENVYRYNTFVDCDGALTFRHGNRCTAEGNFFFGHNRAATGGVRIMGDDHRVINNYFQDLGGSAGRSGLTLMAGLENSPLNGFFQVRNALVAFNTFVNCSNSLALGLQTTFTQNGTNRLTTLPPLNCTIANNVVATTRNSLVDQRLAPVNLNWEGNIMFGSPLGIIPTSGILLVDPQLVLDPDGLWRPGGGSPALAAGQGSYEFITEDIKGVPRPATKDVGCDQRAATPPRRRPLTAGDVGPRFPPTVFLAAPGAGTTIYQGTTITLSAAASDPFGALSRVEFIANGSSVGMDTSVPYQVNFAPLAGNYDLTAVATDISSLAATSAPVHVTVLPPAPPSVALTAPADGVSPIAGRPILLTAVASDLDGVVSRVEFFANGDSLATDSSAPYEASFTPGAGQFVLTAVAIDDDSLSRTSAAVNVTVRTPHAPSGAITEPANAATLVVGWPIHLAANASDPDRTVAEVRFFANGFLIGSDPAPPFQANWSPVAGSYALTAVVVDDDALAATSTVVNVTIATTEGGPRSFRETGGLVVMEAEQFDTNTLAAGHVWVPTNSIAGFVGDSVMQALPNNGATITANIQTGSPALAFRVDFTTPGTYKFWIRGWGAAGSDDSVHLGVDGQLPQTLNYGTSGAWTWRAGQVSIAGPGLHHINLWMREDGAYVDRLLLTTNLAFTPSGGGPIESPRIGGGTKLPPHVVFTTPTDGGVFLAGAPIPITVEASDFDGAVSRVEFFRNGISMGVDTNAPYGTSFAPLTGDYVLTAVATDSDSITTTSTVVFVTIGPPPVVLPALECFVAGGQLTLTYEIPPELKYFDLALKKSSNAVGWTSGDNFFQTSNRTQNANGSERITRRMQLNQLTAPSMYFRLATPP